MVEHKLLTPAYFAGPAPLPRRRFPSGDAPTPFPRALASPSGATDSQVVISSLELDTRLDIVCEPTESPKQGCLGRLLGFFCGSMWSNQPTPRGSPLPAPRGSRSANRRACCVSVRKITQMIYSGYKWRPIPTSESPEKDQAPKTCTLKYTVKVLLCILCVIVAFTIIGLINGVLGIIGIEGVRYFSPTFGT
jgi:hypothetical protein